MEAELFQFIERKHLENVIILLAEDRKTGIILADNGPFEPTKLVLSNGFRGQVISTLFLEQMIYQDVKSFSYRPEDILFSCRSIQLPDLSKIDTKRERIQDLLYLLKYSEDDLHREVLTGQVRVEAIEYFSGKTDKSAINRLKIEEPTIYESLSGSDSMAFIVSTFLQKGGVFSKEVQDKFHFTLQRSNERTRHEDSISFLADEKLYDVLPEAGVDSLCDVDSFAFLRRELSVFKSWDCLNLLYAYCIELSTRYRTKNEQMAVVFYHIQILLKRYEAHDMAKYMIVMLKGRSFLESQKMHNINLEWKINKRLLDMIKTQSLDFPVIELRLIKFLEAFEQELDCNQHQMVLPDANIIYPSYAFQFLNKLFMFFKMKVKEQSRVFSAQFFQDFLQNQL